ncbi:hypothetical protein DIURU_003758 [Diutina rugosa]|uniref:AAA+ ATPase domain-containing protein n=1 Tax=Diutina rugosa TaxID=5481 RepID=A0A642UK35_DIURU|nr:uncharacterized protein DIURU_003758 [Diutina rugosa]KAA8900522.1 hypothetical protein DIURU_003758 [Diutina rugosa]
MIMLRHVPPRVVARTASFNLGRLVPCVRSFSTWQPLRNKSQRDDNVEREIEKLKQLKQRYEHAHFFEKIRLKSEMMNQSIKVQQAQAERLFNDSKKTPVIPVHNPEDPNEIKRYQVIYNFMLNSFLDQCKVAQAYPNAQSNPDTIIDEIITMFKKLHTETVPITKDDVLFYFHIYWAIANNEVYMDELKFDSPVVQNLLDQYVKHSPYDEEIVAKVAKDGNLDPVVVEGWFEVFDTLASTPFSTSDNKLECSLCPLQYAQYRAVTEELNAIQDKIRSLYGKQSQEQGAAKDKKRPFVSFEYETSDSKGQKKRPQSKDEKVIEFRVGPAQLFQIGLLVGLTIFILTSMNDGPQPDELSFQEFVTQLLTKQMVNRLIVVNGKTCHVELNDNGHRNYNHRNFFFNIASIEQFENQLKETQDELKIDPSLRVPVIYQSSGQTSKMLINFLPTLLFLGAIYYMTKKAGAAGMGGPFNFGKSTAKKFNQETDVKVKFKDVAGMQEAKEEVMEFVKFLQNPEKYEKLGAKIPRGAILSGPPGTGKTLLAKATAGEAGVPFYSVSGSEFVEMFVGVGASRVRDLFKTARENAPSIVFIDEIDAIGKQRSKGNASGANDERETTLNQLLVEMDGFDTTDHVVVFAGTNRPDILDKALMRPGRFDRHVYIDNPELQGRKEIFEVHLKKINLSKDIEHDLAGRLAALTPGFSGADIANVCNEAALIAARFDAKTVGLRHFELAIERVIGGVEKKSKVLSPDEKKVVAYHEAGHAVCGWYLEHAHPLLKVSIIPRGSGALGYAQYLPPDQYLYSSHQLIDRMVMTLGGRVSEELHFDFVTSGAHDDFKKVTQIAQSMVLRFGMSKAVGMVNYADTQSQDNLTKPYSDDTNALIDDEIKRIVRECHDRCRDLLKEKADAVELVAQELLKKEFITREDMIRLLGKRPFPETNDAFDKYLDGKDAFKRDEQEDMKKFEDGETKNEDDDKNAN